MRKVWGESEKAGTAFTLIELTIVIAVIGILATTVFVALQPAKRLADARNARRLIDVQNLLIAIKANATNNGGTYLASIAELTVAMEYQIGTAVIGCDSGCTAVTTEAACADLTGLVPAGYLGAIPTDPSTGTAAETDYYVIRNASGTVTIGTCDSEGGVNAVVSQ